MNIVVNAFLNFAQAYGSGTYGSTAYGNGTSAGANAGAATGGSGVASQGANGLVNTGFALVAVVTIACLIIFSALLVRFWRHKSSPAA
jgi:hypothetical protein